MALKCKSKGICISVTFIQDLSQLNVYFISLQVVSFQFWNNNMQSANVLHHREILNDLHYII